MKVKELLEILEEIAPFSLQEEWDNSRLLIGDKNSEVKKIYLTLEIEKFNLEQIKNNSVVITHHPPFFKLTNLVDGYPQELVKKVIKKELSVISMHTNFDKSYLNRFVVEEVLKKEVVKEDGFICYFKVDEKFDKFLDFVMERFSLKVANFVKTKEFINLAAITTGSGGSLIKEVKADIFLTGDIKYHTAMEAMDRGVSLIDITHFGSEKFFPFALKKRLNSYKINCIILTSKNPFQVRIKDE